ncbi:MAG: dTMP kinase [Gammaproteobacteria bacterium]|nr:dTMP kinase [Gammaproteobacteria bacterium]
MTQLGKFITIEGQDGAGKSTNIMVVEACLKEQGIDYLNTREPGGTRLGEQIRELLLSDGDDLIGDYAELLLMFAARAQHIDEVIEPALSSGQWVLCDRFTDATYAYQGGGRGIAMQRIAELEQNVQGELRPDFTLLLDLPVEQGEQRAGDRSAPDRFEQQQIDFKQRVRDCYLQRAAAEPNRIKVVDASASMAQVEAAVISVMQDFLR